MRGDYHFWITYALVKLTKHRRWAHLIASADLMMDEVTPQHTTLDHVLPGERWPGVSQCDIRSGVTRAMRKRYSPLYEHLAACHFPRHHKGEAGPCQRIGTGDLKEALSLLEPEPRRPVCFEQIRRAIRVGMQMHRHEDPAAHEGYWPIPHPDNATQDREQPLGRKALNWFIPDQQVIGHAEDIDADSLYADHVRDGERESNRHRFLDAFRQEWNIFAPDKKVGAAVVPDDNPYEYPAVLYAVYKAESDKDLRARCRRIISYHGDSPPLEFQPFRPGSMEMRAFNEVVAEILR